jgi:hypothetical protein
MKTINYRFLYTIVAIVVILLFIPKQKLFAQFGIGVSYEKREVTANERIFLPEYGFGVRIENDFGPRIPLIKLGWRIHASAFSIEESFNDQLNDVIESNANALVADVGLSLFLEVKMPLFINPYAGGGVGYETRNGNNTVSLLPNTESGESLESIVLNPALTGNAVYYHGFVGMKLSPIPILKPFVEYRYSGLTDFGDLDKIPGRLLFGITLEF